MSQNQCAKPSLNLLQLPTEILNAILDHLYPSWTLELVNRGLDTSSKSTFPRITHILSLVSKDIAQAAQQTEKHTFTHELRFKTSSTQWRTLARLKLLSSQLSWALCNIHTLTFCSPPLFTNRIPWDLFPSLETLKLDYCSRSANFRLEGSWEELKAGELDSEIVGFARDTERFDGAICEDAWRQRVEVRVIKRMSVYRLVPAIRTTWGGWEEVSQVRSWDVKVTARHCGKLKDVSVLVTRRDDETFTWDAIIWSDAFGDEGGFRGGGKKQGDTGRGIQLGGSVS